MRAPSSLQDNIIYLISETQKQLANEMTRIFREQGLEVTAEQFTVLAVLWYQDGVSQKHIAEQINRDKTTVSRLIATMIRRNLLVKTSDPQDGRSTLIYLTTQGKAMQQILVAATGRFYVQALKDISEADHRVALQVLRQIKRNIR